MIKIDQIIPRPSSPMGSLIEMCNGAVRNGYLVERRRYGIPGTWLEQLIVYSSRSRFVKLMALLPCMPPVVTLQRPQP
jgi:hypothetical protein